MVLVPATERAGQMQSRAAEILSYWSLSASLRLWPVPMEQGGEQALLCYDAMCQEAIQLQQKGLRVAVAAEGDVGVYASIHYVMERLMDRGVAVEQVPGIPSFVAAAAQAHLSLVSHQERLLVVPGISTADEMERLLQSGHTLVVMKLSQSETVIKSFISSHPSSVSFHYFEHIGMSRQFHTTDTDIILSRPFPYFSLMVVMRA